VKDAWSHPVGGLPRSVPNREGDDGLDPAAAAERARQDYIRRVTNDWKSGPRDPAAAADRIEALRRRTMAEDAAADGDAAYREYCARISTDWMR
jgi:hypothetical protein